MKIAAFTVIFSIAASSASSTEISAKRKNMIKELAQGSVTLWDWISSDDYGACPYQPNANGVIRKAHPDCGEKQTLSLPEWYEQQAFLCEYQPFLSRNKRLFTRDELCREMIEVMAQQPQSPNE